MNRSTKARRDIGAVTAGGAAVGVIVTYLYRLWDLKWSVPLNYQGDSLLTLNTISNIVHFGSYAHNNHLGYPFGQNLLDFPANGDVFSLSLIRVITFFTPRPGLVLNVLFLFSYFFVFFGAYIGFRIIRITPAIASGLAILYAFIPYHQLRGVPHVFLCMYGFVPVWCSFLVRELGPNPISETLRLRGRKVLVFVFAGLGVLATTTGIYYTMFFLSLTSVVVVLNIIRKQSLSVIALVVSICAAGASVIVMFWNVLSFHLKNGGNPSAIVRSLDQVQYWSLKPLQLLLPIEDHRIPVLRNWINSRDPFVRSGEFGTSLGFVLSLGLILTIVAVAKRLRLGRSSADQESPSIHLGVLMTATLLVGVTGGFGFLLGIFGFVEIRVWERIVVVIAFLACCQLGSLLTRRKKSTTKFQKIGLLALLILSLLDMTPSNLAAERSGIERSWKFDYEVAAVLSSHFGPEVKVAQLPVVVFPENGPREQMLDYEHLRGFVHLPSGFFSYGSVKGRGGRWQEKLSGDPKLQVEQLVSLGFEALWLDSRGYAYDSLIPDTYREYVGRQNLVIRRGALEIYDLRNLRDSISKDRGPDYLERLKEQVLSPLFFYYGGFSGVETDGVNYWVTSGRESHIFLVSTSAEVGLARLRFKASPLVKARLVVEGPCKEGRVREVKPAAAVTCTFEIGTKAKKVSLSTRERRPRPGPPPSRLLRVSETTFEFVN